MSTPLVVGHHGCPSGISDALLLTGPTPYFGFSKDALIAIARASETSSGPSIFFTPSVIATIFLRDFLSHRPSPATTLFILLGVNSSIGTFMLFATKTITPLASATEIAVFLFLEK